MVVVFFLLGIVFNCVLFIWEWCLVMKVGEKSKIFFIVGIEYVAIGRYFSMVVVGVIFLGLVYFIFFKFINKNLIFEEFFWVLFIIVLFILSIIFFIFFF